MEKLSVTKCKVCGEKLIVPSDKSFFIQDVLNAIQ